MLVLWIMYLALSACKAYPELYCDGPNEVATKCTSLCPQFCNISYTEYVCDEKCKPGCDCKEGYLRNRDGDCVYRELCEAPTFIPECDKDEIAVPCTEACSDSLCQLLPMFEYVCTKEKAPITEDINDENDVVYECPIGYDPKNIPAIFVSNVESTVIGVDFPHPTKYKRPEIIEIERTVSYFAPFIKDDKNDEKKNDS